MAETLTFGLELEQQEGFEFRVRFDWPGVQELLLDEPEPLGRRRGPERGLEQFEDFCVVTQSIRAGIPVNVSVVDAEGKVADAVA